MGSQEVKYSNGNKYPHYNRTETKYSITRGLVIGMTCSESPWLQICFDNVRRSVRNSTFCEHSHHTNREGNSPKSYLVYWNRVGSTGSNETTVVICLSEPMDPHCF